MNKLFAPFKLIVTAALAFLFLICSYQSISSSPSDAPSVQVEVDQAKAIESCTDEAYVSPWCREDFKVRVSLAGGTPVMSGYVNNRDSIAWYPPFTVSYTIPDPTDLPRKISARVELFDDDDKPNPDDPFDIFSGAGKPLDLTFDTCTFRVSGGGLLTQSPGFNEYPPGHESDPAKIELAIRTGDGKPFSPYDVAIADISPVQVVYKPRYIIADKPTSLRLHLTSSWPDDRGVHIRATFGDGYTTATEERDVIVPPEGLWLIMFDWNGTQPPYIPTKTGGGVGTFTYDVDLDVVGEPPPDIPPRWGQCHLENNQVSNATLPIIKTRVPLTVYTRWNWIFSPDRISMPELRIFRNENSKFFGSIFPIEKPNAYASNLFMVSMYTGIEPAASIGRASLGANIAGIDRLVLTVPQTWFEDMDAAHLLWVGDGGNTGMSLAEAADHAVLAENGYSEVAVHEIGHTYRLSQRGCTPSDAGLGLLEYFAGMGCRDEYTHTAADGAPYKDDGFDVRGNIYPIGFDIPLGSRNLNQITNFMDTTPATLDNSSPHNRWMDTFSYDIVSDQMRLGQDPDLITISGMVKLEGWPELTGTISGDLTPVYKTSGVPTLESPPYGQSAGEGSFSVVVKTGQGDRRYRFMPSFGTEGQDFNGYGIFSFTVPWEIGITALELYGPGNLNQPSQIYDILLDTITRSPQPPVVSRLLAGKNIPPDMQGQGTPPYIATGDSAYIRWIVTDLDTPSGDLRAALLLLPPPSQEDGIYNGFIPMEVEIEGDHLVVKHSQLLDQPGLYGGRLVVTDGLNSVTFDNLSLFIIEASTYLPILMR